MSDDLFPEELPQDPNKMFAYLLHQIMALREEIYGSVSRPGVVSKLTELEVQLYNVAERQQNIESIIYKTYQATLGVGVVITAITILQFFLFLWR